MLERPHSIVINTTPLIAIAVATGRLDVLQCLYQNVIVPAEVEQEIRAAGSAAPCPVRLGAASRLPREKMMSIETVLPLVQALPHSAKFQLMQVLLAQLAQEEGLSLQMPSRLTMNRGQQMAAILQRMADRHALSAIADPAEWQKNIRQDRPLPGRE